LYPYEDWLKFEQKLTGLSSVDPNYQAYSRFCISGANECPIDNQGRLQIPRFLREHADLKREVTIAGVGAFIELWNKERFDAEITKTHARFTEISSEVAKLGR
jgi:MraZ protein